MPLPTPPALPQVCVCYLLRERDGRVEVLLGRKKHGLGAGYFVAPGGKLEPGESAVEAVVREVREESGLEIEASDLEARGVITYLFPHREAWTQQSSVFVCRTWRGEPVPSDELDPEWHPVDEVPLDQMWDDARRWLPGVLAGGSVSRTFAFGADLATVVGESRGG
ncbi:NUDIX domain-containing protein [Agromyces sp. CFH 90414]|uniref:Oxidized purine nucleoside triphosphate hydrolase n=1 Tax=Agromyces agglutinans TaxID=2662258 RepID=A0A6I2F971_9MICO|nr:8-oxo-dGTP diphosphatase [Agromyces agglutinans]MRG61412.1 NUDIX domain-containing protein [Agromyces agglutinans]